MADLLQSGFIALDDDGFSVHHEQKQNPITANAMYNTTDDKVKHGTLYHGPVTRFYKEQCDDIRTLKAFEEKEQVLLFAIKLFGRNLESWYRLQAKSNAYTERHQMYLDDTFGFIAGNKRQLSHESWYRLLGDTRVDRSGYQRNKWFTRESKIAIPSNIADVLAAWVSREEGIYDLLETLYVIFGKRP